MAGRAKVSLLSGLLKESYTDLMASFAECPNCSEILKVEHQKDVLKQLYYVTVKCNSCSFVSLGYIPHEATLSMGLSALISHVVEDLVSVDLIAQTECELERELELEHDERDLKRELEHDLPF